MSKNLTAEEVERVMPGFLADIESRGVQISNNAGALLVDGYLSLTPRVCRTEPSRSRNRRRARSSRTCTTPPRARTRTT